MTDILQHGVEIKRGGDVLRLLECHGDVLQGFARQDQSIADLSSVELDVLDKFTEGARGALELVYIHLSDRTIGVRGHVIHHRGHRHRP